EYQIQVDTPPRLETVELHITPPAYAGSAVRQIQGGDAEILRGSIVMIVASLRGQTAKRADLIQNHGAEQSMTMAGNRAYLELKPQDSISYGLKLSGANGLTSNPPDRWLLKVVP